MGKFLVIAGKRTILSDLRSKKDKAPPESEVYVTTKPGLGKLCTGDGYSLCFTINIRA